VEIRPRKADVACRGGNTIVFSRECQVTGKTHEVTVSKEAYEMWCTRKLLIQEAFPGLSEDDRELILTGYTPAEWAEIFPQEGDEDEDEDE
jgi:hypothetical protein